jgi:hypothetical protein
MGHPPCKVVQLEVDVMIRKRVWLGLAVAAVLAALLVCGIFRTPSPSVDHEKKAQFLARVQGEE